MRFFRDMRVRWLVAVLLAAALVYWFGANGVMPVRGQF